MKTTTEISLVTIQQRLNMLPTPPASPVTGPGFERVELSSDRDVVIAMMWLSNPHIVCVSVRQAINKFGKIGYPKIAYCSPEFYALFA